MICFGARSPRLLGVSADKGMLQKLRHVLDPLFAPGLIARMRELDELRALDDRMLRDIGITATKRGSAGSGDMSAPQQGRATDAWPAAREMQQGF